VRRISFQNSRGLRLAGLLYPANSDAVIVMAHGFASDKGSSGRFDYIAQCLARAGYNAITFDFSGCGESDDDSLTIAKEVDDLEAAIAHARASGFRRLALWGNSLGCRICLQAAPPEIATMVLAGTGAGPTDWNWEEHFTPKQLRELAKTGRITEHREAGPRSQVVIDAQMLREFTEFDQPKILGRIKCPVLIVNGDGDEEEVYLNKIAKGAMRYLPAGSRHEVIHGAVHGFWRHLDQVIDLAFAWLETHLLVKPAG
jgi:pimeloyl-ACP methyl ester carboxylesterase